MLPRAQLEGCVVRPLEDGCIVLAPGHKVHKLGAVCASLLRRADGQTALPALTAAVSAELGRVVAADEVTEGLDRLADAGLLAQRVAPPAGVSRRGMLTRLAGAAAVAALTAVLRPTGAEAAEGGVCGEEKALIDEIAWLQAEQEGVADILEGWVEDAIADEKVDEFYLEALKLKEQARKKSAADYEAKSEDLEGDLAACKFELTAAGKQKADEQRKKHVSSTMEKATAKLKVRQEQHYKQAQKQGASEAEHKAKLSSMEKEAKADQNFKKADEATTKMKQSQAQLLKKKAMEEEKKQREQQQYKDRMGDLTAKEAALKEKTREKLVNSEERAKVWSDSYAARKDEELAKQYDQNLDRYTELAQEDAMKAMETGRRLEQDYKYKQAAEQKKKMESAELAKEQELKAYEKQTAAEQEAKIFEKKKAEEQYAKKAEMAVEEQKKGI
jgi:hypothetical protein